MLRKIMLLMLSIVCMFHSIGYAGDLNEKAEEPQTIIFDLGGVLTEVDRMLYASCIGLRFFLYSIAREWEIPYSSEKRVFEFLNRITLSGHPSLALSGACVTGGRVMPPLMIAFQAGLLKRDEILPLLKEELLKADKEGFFKHDVEKLLLERMSEEMFNPASLVYSVYLIPQGLSIIRFLAAQTLSDGKKPRYCLYILSNWEPTSFQSIREKFPEFFSYFDGIVVSGNIGMVKPSPSIFEHLVKTYTLDKERCIFIDDQPENIKAAQAYGIGTPLLFKNYKQLTSDLAQVGVIVPSQNSTDSSMYRFFKKEQNIALFLALGAIGIIGYKTLRLRM